MRPPLLGTYTPPAVRKGERVTCLYRDADCVVTGWHDGRIPWPRVRAREHLGGSGLWVNEDLARAVCTESAVALMYWFGVGSHAVWRWRAALGVGGHGTTPGSRRANRAAALKAGEVLKAKEWTAAELARKSKAALKCGTRPGPRWTPKNGGWTGWELALVGTDSDKVIALRIGRTRGAVRGKRRALGIPPYSDGVSPGRPWTVAELALLGTDHDRVIAARINRSVEAVTTMRVSRGIRAASGFTGGGRKWTAREEKLLGTADDGVIAARLGRSRMAVTLRRVARGIPTFRDHRRSGRS
jgi:hypothetical protein